MTTLVSLLQTAASELGFAAPPYVIGNPDATAVQLLALANAAGKEMAREFPWQALNKEYRFTTAYLATTGSWNTASPVVTGIPATATLAANTWMASGMGIPQDTYVKSVDSATQVTLSQTPMAAGTGGPIVFGQTKYALPADFDRQQDRTQYDKSKRWEMQGPETAQQWQFLKSSYIATGPRLRYRIMGGYFQIWPMIATPETIGFEYVSNAWVSSAGGVAQAAFAADTDACIFDDRLMILAIKKKFFEIKGFDAGYFTRDYQAELSIAKANDQGSATLSFAPRAASVLVGWENIPDSNYGM